MTATTEPHTIQSCNNCGHDCPDEFCGHCGQKKPHPGDMSLNHACHHVVEELFHLDGKVFHSIRLLLTRPGQLTLDYIEGRRARHVHPIRLFLVFVFLYFLFAPINPFLQMGPTISQQITANSDRRQMFESFAQRKGKTLAAALADANSHLASMAKPMDIAIVVINGLAIWMLFRKRRLYLAESMTMGLHIASFNMAAQLVLGWLGVALSLKNASYLPALAVTAVYFVLAARRVYGDGWISIVLKYLAMQIIQSLVVYITLLVAYLFFFSRTGH